MSQRSMRVATALALLVFCAAELPAHAAKYRYGRHRRSQSTQSQGFFLQVEGALTNPRNTDLVVATVEGGGRFDPVIPRWGDDPAARLGFGYRWASGSVLQGSVWGFKADTGVSTSGAALGGNLHFPIGPPLAGVGDIGSPGTIDITTEVKARTADVSWGKLHELSEDFTLEWSVGLRYADFQETHEGSYGQLGGATYAASKSNEGEMIGARVALAAVHHFTSRFSVGGSLGFSMLDGEHTASSSLTLAGQSSPASASRLSDDSRSGRILDLDVGVNWHLLGDALRLTLGWGQSTWEDISADLMRNYPGTTVPLRDRHRVTFSGYKLGLLARF